MKITKILGLGLIAVIGGLVLAGGCLAGGYNQVVQLDEKVKSAWAQVESQLQRRYDLIPNLVETVKGVAAQEQDVFLGIAKAREAYFQAKSPADKAQAANVVESALSRLLVLRETYPELKSNQSFLKLQDSIEGTENRLSVERMRYNESVRDLNAFTRRILGRLYAALAGVGRAEYFEVAPEAESAPKVDFSKPTP